MHAHQRGKVTFVVAVCQLLESSCEIFLPPWKIIIEQIYFAVEA